MSSNFDLDFNNNVENFEVEFGEVTRLTEDDFNQLRNRPSYNGNVMTGETNIPAVPTRTSDLQNDSDYQTGADVQSAISGKQDVLTPGTGINISNDTISIDSTVVATQQNLATEVTNRENADNALQSQIDAISASSDVVDIVGTYAELQNYDTSELGDNDIIKVLQDSTQNNATTYYRWSTTTQTFTLIGQEGPYYTKAAADAQFVPQTRTVNGKPLSANITLNASDVSALSPSDVDTQLANSTNPVQNKVLYGLLGDMPADFFSGEASDTQTGTDITIGEAIGLTDLKMFGDTEQESYTGKNLLYVPDGSRTSSGLTWTMSNGAITASGTSNGSSSLPYVLETLPEPLPAGTYTFSIDKALSVGSFQFDYYDENNTEHLIGISAGQTSATFTITHQIAKQRLKLAAVASGDIIDFTIYAQLEAGSTATSYEPYTGGQPSPSPDYPQEIQTVTGEQVLTTRGKNLVDATDLNYIYTNAEAASITLTTLPTGIRFDYSRSGNPVTMFKLMDLTGHEGAVVRMSASFDSTATGYRLVLSDSTGNDRVTVANTAISGEVISFIVPANLGDRPFLCYMLRKTGNSTSDFTDLIVTIDNDDMSYEPYHLDTYTINLGTTELCKIGDYQDYIYKSGGDWYVHKEIRKVVYDGSETWDQWSYGAAFIRTENNEMINPSSRTNNLVLSDKFIQGASTTAAVQWNNFPNNTISIRGGGSFPLLGFKTDIVGNLSDWRTWLSSNNVTTYYVLATATDTQITDQTLIDGLNSALNMTCYDGGTNIVVTSTNLPGELELTAANKTLGGIIAMLRGRS